MMQNSLKLLFKILLYKLLNMYELIFGLFCSTYINSIFMPFLHYIFLEEFMIKYSNKTRQHLQETLPSYSYVADYVKTSLNSSKVSTNKPSLLTLSKHSNNQNQRQSILTPKTAKLYLEKSSKLAENLSKSINIANNKQKIKKDHSFIQFKTNDQYSIDGFRRDNYQKSAQITDYSKTDRSQRTFKNKESNNQYRQKPDEFTKLRQTVSNLNSWQYRIDLSSTTQNLKDILPTQEPNLRKKIQSQYSQLKKDIKSKLSSKQHSRTNSRIVDSQAVDMLANYPPSTSKTPPKSRVSQDNLISGLARKNKTMSQTDPSGNYFQLSMSRRISTIKPVQWKINDFWLGACKGQGRFGKVFPAIHKKTGFLLAIKQVTKESVRLMIEQFVQEIKINLFLNHPNIVKMFGYFSDSENIYILMEYMEQGSLYKHVKLAKRINEEEASQKLQQICEAVRYLHSQDILHRDIKPQNIVLTNGVCKLCDFGWAAYSKQRRNTYCGTLDYVCPQILQGQSYDNFVDIWAIGVLAYQMLVGKAPFYHISRKQTMKSIMNCQFSFPADISIIAKLFIMKALQKNPDKRFTIESLTKDRFLAQVPRFT